MAGSPAESSTMCFWKSPRGAPCSTRPSRSAPQKLECTSSAPLESSVEISAPNCPAKSFVMSEVFTSMPGLRAFIAASKSVHESWPQA